MGSHQSRIQPVTQWTDVCLISQSCPTVCDPRDCSLPGTSVHGILQARVLEWVAMPSSRGSSQPRDQTQISHIADRFFTIWATREAVTQWTKFLFLQKSSVLKEERSKSKSSSWTITNLYIAGSQHGASINSLENSYIEGSKWTVVLMIYDSSWQPHHHHGRW